VDLMSIGEFARLSRLSAKALRLYDELGLLPPAPGYHRASNRRQQARRQRLRPPAARPGRRRMIRGAARRDDNDGQRRYVRAAGDPDTEGYFDASG
jgi:IS5 family transposase